MKFGFNIVSRPQWGQLPTGAQQGFVESPVLPVEAASGSLVIPYQLIRVNMQAPYNWYFYGQTGLQEEDKVLVNNSILQLQRPF